MWNLSQQISVLRFRSDKRDDCVWAFPLYPADGTKLSLQKHNYSHVKKNTLGIVLGVRPRGTVHAQARIRQVHLQQNNEPTSVSALGNLQSSANRYTGASESPGGKGAWKQGEKVEDEECLWEPPAACSQSAGQTATWALQSLLQLTNIFIQNLWSLTSSLVIF